MCEDIHSVICGKNPPFPPSQKRGKKARAISPLIKGFRGILKISDIIITGEDLRHSA
jgi:hypothetical protein